MLIAEVLEDGTILDMLRYETRGTGKEEIMQILLRGIKEYEETKGWRNGKRPDKIGIGINGIIDPVEGIWKKLGTETCEIAVKKVIEEALSVKCYVDNDVKCTVMAENQFGAGRGCRDMIYLNVGTGLAAGIISNGRIIRGTDGFAGEIGFMNFTEGKGIHVEMLASGMGIRYQAKQLQKEYPESLLSDHIETGVTGAELYEAAEKGDALANRILEQLIRMNSLMITNLTCVLSPEIVVLGGGLFNNKMLLEKIREAVGEKAKEHLEKGVVLTGLNPAYAGLLGAAAIGLEHQQEYA